MSRFLCIGLTDNGDVKGCIVTQDDSGPLPFGDHAVVLAHMEIDELTAIVELPEDDFRPALFDCTADEEATVGFLDL